MEKVLLEFIETLEWSVKKLQEELEDRSGLSKLTISQIEYIEAIYLLGSPTVTDIAERLDITKPSASTGINKLTKMGYLQKTQSTEDKRVYHISLTELGESLIKTKYRALQEYTQYINRVLTDEEARQFEATLTKIVKLFNEA